MVTKAAAALTSPVTAYLDRTLGVGELAWSTCPEGPLPAYLDHAYTVVCTDLLGTACAFAFRRTSDVPSPSSTSRQIDHLASILRRPVVLVESVIPSWRRKRLIERRVAFVAPGTQLYVPPLGIDLRDGRHRRPTDAIEADRPFPPAAQVVLLDLLLARDRHAHDSHAIANRIRYSVMSISRAARTLERAGLIDRPTRGRNKLLSLRGAPREVWANALPHLTSPVRARYAAPPGAFADAPDAGETALARHSLLAAPATRTVAVSGEAWSKQEGRYPALGAAFEPEPGSVIVEVWTYPPDSLADGPTVDPLSLFLSLGDADDPRIETAREALLEVLA